MFLEADVALIYSVVKYHHYYLTPIRGKACARLFSFTTQRFFVTVHRNDTIQHVASTPTRPKTSRILHLPSSRLPPFDLRLLHCCGCHHPLSPPALSALSYCFFLYIRVFIQNTFLRMFQCPSFAHNHSTADSLFQYT
jgi:hypothetical protein